MRAERIIVSSTTASAKVASTLSSGEPGKYTSPSAYPRMSPENRKSASQSSVVESTTFLDSRNRSSSDVNVKSASISRIRPVPATTP